MDFQLFFNNKRQWVNVHFWDVHPSTFKAWGGGRWGYYIGEDERKKIGLFGHLHFVKSRVREDVFDHEKMHLLGDILRDKNKTWSVNNEERICSLSDFLTRQFWRKWKKI
jgi:hypothetical protein